MKRILSLLVFFSFLSFIYAEDSESRLQTLEAALKKVSERPLALPAAHRLSVRLKKEIKSSRELSEKIRGHIAQDAPEELIEMRLRSLQKMVHRLNGLYLRTQIVKASLEKGMKEPKYGLMVKNDLARIVSNRYPEFEALDRVELSAARGEAVSFQVVAVPFDGGFSFPGYPAKYGPYEVETLTHIDGKTRIKDEHIFFSRQDELRLEEHKDDALSVGGYPDPLQPWSPYNAWSVESDYVQSYRVRISIPYEQKAGIYRGRLRFWPTQYEQPRYIDVMLTVWDFVLPRPGSLRTRVKAGYYSEGVRKWFYAQNPKDARCPKNFDGFKGSLQNLLAEYSIEGVQDKVLAAEPGWAVAEEGGPLSIKSKPALLRRLPWKVWAEGSKGVIIPALFDWRQQWRTADSRWASGAQMARIWQFANPARVRDLFYPSNPNFFTFVPSVRLEILRDGMEDVEYFVLLEKKKEELSANAAFTKQAELLLKEAKDAALLPAREVTTDKLLGIRARAGALLSDIARRD